MNEELYDFIYGIEEKETPNLDQVDKRYYRLIKTIGYVNSIVLTSIITIIYFYFVFIERITKIEPIILIFGFSICLFTTTSLSVFIRYNRIIYPYMVKKNPKAYVEYQNLLPDYYYIMDWVKLKKEV